MKAIAKLKDDARKFEQKEEWEKAIQAYLEVLQIGEEGDGSELDLPLYNRVGDIYVRLGRASDAVTYYEKAADHYAEAGLYNNAIALCNKALRYDAGRLELTKKLGFFSASQGFFTDARRWYLEYAEKSIKRGQLDEAFSALSDYAAVNDDPEIRELLARQLRDHGRKERAVEEFQRAHALRLAAGQQAEADVDRSEILAIDPSAEISTASGAAQPHVHVSREEQLPGLVDLDAKKPAAQGPPEPEPEKLLIEQTGVEGGLDVSADTDYGSITIESGFTGTDAADASEVAPLDIGLEAPLGVEPDEMADDAAAFELPMLEEEGEEEAAPLPTFDDFGSSEEAAELPMLAEEADTEPLPGFDGVDVSAELPMIETVDFGDGELDIGGMDMGELEVGELERDETGLAGAPLPTLDFGGAETAEVEEIAEAEAEAETLLGLPGFDETAEAPFGLEEIAREPIAEEPVAEEPVAEEPVAEEPVAEEPAEEEAPVAEAPVAEAPAAEAAVVEQPHVARPAPAPLLFEVAEPEAAAPPLPPPPPAKPKPEYVDLAAMMGEDDEEAEDSTRFVVAEKPPTGDEEQDFADMLNQFKAKVAETIPKEDAGSHYDLGIAFKEMGLIDEAIGEFQTALRAGQEKLKVYEELGSCFVMKAQYSVAVTILNRAQQMPYTDEQELLGVYYNLGRAHEELGQRAEAKAAYEKIVAIDIGFQDTTTRLARL